MGKYLEGCCQARNCTILCFFLTCIYFLSHHTSKWFIQKVLSHFIFLYFACCWDFSGTSLHTWSESHNFYICVHCYCSILSNPLTVAYCHALHFSILVVGYVFGSSFICTFFTLVWKLPNPHRYIVFIIPSLSVCCYIV